MDYRNTHTLVEPVEARAQSDPDRLAIVFMPEDGEPERITAGQFAASMHTAAYALAQIGIGQQDLVVLVLNHSRILLSAFWGAMSLGAIPSIFPFLTEKLDPELYMERVHALVQHEGARAVITFPEFEPRLKELLADTDCRVISMDDIPNVAGAKLISPLRGRSEENAVSMTDADAIAFLQHSSGTTGLQKGVALSHRAVLNQIEAYSRAIDLRDDDVVVSWLPLYHDMGLIAGFVMPIVAGIPLVMMSPFQWVRSPKTLLQAIHQYRGTLCWLPNFAYNHSALTIRQRDLEGLDLSSWRAAINCSEPVRLHSHQIFVDKFGPYGFKESALATSYAMAEMVFAVTQTEIGRPPRVEWIEIEAYQKDQAAVPAEPDALGAMPVVSCGRPIDGVEVAVIDANGERLPERRHGQIITRGSAMLTGYYKHPDLTEEALLDGWYKTGDMGYIADGEVYVSGRAKDLIIVAGKNVYPQDLEAIANTVPGVYPGRAVAFGVEDAHLGTESIVMVCEVDGEGGEDPKALAAEIRKRVVQQSEVTLNDVRLVEERWVIKTSSGKIARADNRAKYLKEFRGG